MLGLRPPARIRWFMDHECPVPIDIYREFAYHLTQAIVDNPDGVTLPLKLGWIKILGNSQPPSVDKGMSKRVFGARPNKKVSFKVYDTDGLVFKAIWFSSVVGQTEDVVKAAFSHSDMYAFKSSGILRKAMAAKIGSGAYRDYHLRDYVAKVKSANRRGRPRKLKPTENDTTGDSQPIAE